VCEYRLKETAAASSLFAGFLRRGEAHCRSLPSVGMTREEWLLTYNSASRMAQKNSRSDSQNCKSVTALPLSSRAKGGICSAPCGFL
jgi:hypothetical protein